MSALRRLSSTRRREASPSTLLTSGHFLRGLAVVLFLIALFQAISLMRTVDEPSAILGEAFKDISGRLWLATLTDGAYHSGLLWGLGEILLHLGRRGGAEPT